MTEFWWRDGICAEIGADVFFIGDGASNALAKQACGLCGVREQCLAASLSTDTEYGVFGGFGRDTRRRLTKQVQAGADPLAVAREAIDKEANGSHTDPQRRDHPRWSGRHVRARTS